MHLRIPPLPIKLSYCQRIDQRCDKTFCWCYIDSKRQIHHEPEQIITTISNQEAERKILIKMECIRYIDIDTPSRIRVLSPSDQLDFYKDNFHKDALKYCLLDN